MTEQTATKAIYLGEAEHQINNKIGDPPEF